MLLRCFVTPIFIADMFDSKALLYVTTVSKNYTILDLSFAVFWHFWAGGGIWYESVFLSTLKDDTSICSPFLLTLAYLSFLMSFILFPYHLFILQMEALTINFQVNKSGLCSFCFFLSFLELNLSICDWLLLFCLELDKFDFHAVLHHFYS